MITFFIGVFMGTCLGFLIAGSLGSGKVVDLEIENWKLREDNGRLRYNAEVIRNAK